MPNAKFEDLSWSPRTHRTEGEDPFLQAVFLPQQARSACTCVHTHKLQRRNEATYGNTCLESPGLGVGCRREKCV